jgi:hypothetical protein
MVRCTEYSMNFFMPGCVIMPDYVFLLMLQSILILLIFIAAMIYLGRILYRSFFRADGGCATACGKCGAIDFAKIEKQIKSNLK